MLLNPSAVTALFLNDTILILFLHHLRCFTLHILLKSTQLTKMTTFLTLGEELDAYRKASTVVHENSLFQNLKV